MAPPYPFAIQSKSGSVSNKNIPLTLLIVSFDLSHFLQNDFDSLIGISDSCDLR